MKLWYAVMEDREDYDWGYGSYDRKEAENMALEMGPDTYIAVIDTEGDPICIEEISQEDFGMRTKYAIRDVPYDYDMTDEPTDCHIFEADSMEAITAELIRIGADDEHYSIGEYRVDEDGRFYDGSDYDTPSNFRKRTATRRSVKDICKMAGMTQSAMAERFGIPWRTFSNWCRGTNECPAYTKLMMQEILGLYRR